MRSAGGECSAPLSSSLSPSPVSLYVALSVTWSGYFQSGDAVGPLLLRARQGVARTGLESLCCWCCFCRVRATVGAVYNSLLPPLTFTLVEESVPGGSRALAARNRSIYQQQTSLHCTVLAHILFKTSLPRKINARQRRQRNQTREKQGSLPHPGQKNEISETYVKKRTGRCRCCLLNAYPLCSRNDEARD